MRLDDWDTLADEDVSVVVDAVMENLIGRVGYSKLAADRQVRFSIGVTEQMRHRLDTLARLFGMSRSEVVSIALLVGVSELEDDLIRAWKETHEA